MVGCSSKDVHRAFRITCQGVCLSGEDNPNRSIHREIKIPQFTRGEVLTCLKSLVYYPKPDDLFLGKVKRW